MGIAAAETIMKRLTAAIILGLASLFFAVNPAVAQNDAKVTARDVVDRESLNAFVLEAREYLDSFETLSGYRDALESFRAGGDWKQGSVYPYVGTTDGVVVFHAVDPDLEGSEPVRSRRLQWRQNYAGDPRRRRLREAVTSSISGTI